MSRLLENDGDAASSGIEVRADGEDDLRAGEEEGMGASPGDGGGESGGDELLTYSNSGQLVRVKQKLGSVIEQNDADVRAGMTNEEIEFALWDWSENEESTLEKQTISRWLVENFLAKYKWYNPNGGSSAESNAEDSSAPCLSRGWAFFERFTLPRHFVEDDANRKNRRGIVWTRASPGEKKTTRLYSVFSTPQSSLSDFGVGVGMYFSTLATVGVIFIIAGLIQLPMALYYGGDEYDPDERRDTHSFLRYSAMCTHREWVQCVGCKEQDIGINFKRSWNNTFANQHYGISEEGAILIHRTACLESGGWWNYAALMFLVVSVGLYNFYQQKKEVRSDEDNTTAADYTVKVENPPPDALDPEEWREFFDRFSDKQVTLCTIALDNEKLLKKLLERRRGLKTLRSLIAKETDMDDEQSVNEAVKEAAKKRTEERRSVCSAFYGSTLVPILRLFGLAPTEEQLWKRIQDLTAEVKTLQESTYKAAAVFVTFETEQGQRNALTAMNAGHFEVWMNNSQHVSQDAVFQGKVLSVREASEPNTVRWLDLSSTTSERIFVQIVTLIITVGMIVVATRALLSTRYKGTTIEYAILLSTLNFFIPEIVRFMVRFEKHTTESTSQISLYLKVTFFRWMNTAVITLYVTPHVSFLGDTKTDLMNTVNALLLSEMFVSPFLRYIDIGSFIKRHILAPRATTQEAMYNNFLGGVYTLADRFTDFTKVLLLCIFYSAFYPLIYFLGAAILCIQYWTDKFLLLRSWRRQPFLGPQMAQFSRKYFTTGAIVIGAMSSSYAYTRMPYSYLCFCDDNDNADGGVCDVSLTATQFSNVKLLDGTTIDAVDTKGLVLKYCRQWTTPHFPPWKQGDDKWMDTEYFESLPRVYGWTCLVLLIVYIVGVLGERIVQSFQAFWRGVYKPSGVDQCKDFSSGIAVETLGYIPQLQVPGFHFPFLACDIDDIDVNLIGWGDPNQNKKSQPHQNYDDHNLIFDVPTSQMRRYRHEALEVASRTGTAIDNCRPVFSIIKHWPPSWALHLRENSSST